MALARPMFAALLLSTGCSDEGGTKGSGAATFRRICSQCHGLTGKGMPNLGKDVTTSMFVASNTDQQLMDFIKGGRALDHPENTTGVAMPPMGGDPTLTDDQIMQIIVFVRSIQVQPDRQK